MFWLNAILIYYIFKLIYLFKSFELPNTIQSFYFTQSTYLIVN